MTTAMQIYKNPKVGEMRCYVGEDNLIYLNAEDVAIGLGFVKYDKKGKLTVLWSLINDTLKQSGYEKKIKKEEFVPENMFYFLAMKADNEAATKFQLWIANEVIPQIRRTGSYSVTSEISERQEVRQAQIKARKDATGVYEMYSAYARRQGDQRKVGRIYAKFSKLANRVAGIPHGCRDLATANQLKICAMAEKIIAETIMRGIAANLHYKDIEEDVMCKGTDILQFTANQFPQLR